MDEFKKLKLKKIHEGEYIGFESDSEPDLPKIIHNPYFPPYFPPFFPPYFPPDFPPYFPPFFPPFFPPYFPPFFPPFFPPYFPPYFPPFFPPYFPPSFGMGGNCDCGCYSCCHGIRIIINNNQLIQQTYYFDECSNGIYPEGCSRCIDCGKLHTTHSMLIDILKI